MDMETSSTGASIPQTTVEKRGKGGGDRQISLHPLAIIGMSDHWTRIRSGSSKFSVRGVARARAPAPGS